MAARAGSARWGSGGHRREAVAGFARSAVARRASGGGLRPAIRHCGGTAGGRGRSRMSWTPYPACWRTGSGGSSGYRYAQFTQRKVCQQIVAQGAPLLRGQRQSTNLETGHQRNRTSAPFGRRNPLALPRHPNQPARWPGGTATAVGRRPVGRLHRLATSGPGVPLGTHRHHQPSPPEERPGESWPMPLPACHPSRPARIGSSPGGGDTGVSKIASTGYGMWPCGMWPCGMWSWMRTALK